MPEPWKTKEWKEKRAKLVEGKSCEWCGSTRALSIHHQNTGLLNTSRQHPDFEKFSAILKAKYEKERQSNLAEYMSMENTIILCKKCHKAIGNGLVLCKVCKQGYHRPEFTACFKCFSKTEKGKEVVRNNELVEYTVPKCKKTLKIKRSVIDLGLAEHTCCTALCKEFLNGLCEGSHEEYENEDDNIDSQDELP